MFEVKVTSDYNKQQIYIEVPGKKVPRLLIDHKKLTPTEVVEAANTLLAWALTKYPELKDIVQVTPYKIKQQYYNQRRFITTSRHYSPPNGSARQRSHVCQDFNSLNPNVEYCSSNGMGGREQVPDIIGEIIVWKAWPWDPEQNLLRSNYGNLRWLPMIPIEAECHSVNKCPAPPCINCSCGIYAATEQGTAKGYGVVLGKVKLWGRFLQGEHGYRAQFAYPAEFHLNPEQRGMVEQLKVYNVPIFAYTPSCVWRPEPQQ